MTSQSVATPAASTAQHGRLAVASPYGIGAEIAAALPPTWDCIAVTPPSRDLPPLYRYAFDPRPYRDVVHHHGNVGSTAQRLRALGVTAVMAGTEIGVHLADQLAHELGLAGNQPTSSHLRRDKGSMAAALESNGLASPATLVTDSLREAIRFATASPAAAQEWIVKPTNSAGSDGVRICTDSDDVHAAWDELFGTDTVLGERIDRLVIQERLVGWQYAVNTVSLPRLGHTVTEVWFDQRIQGHLYDRLDLLDPQSPLPKLVADYTCRALDALGVEYGPAHSEVMLTRQGPVLIETGAHPEGCYSRQGMLRATGSDQVADAVLVLTTGFAPTPAHTADRHVCRVSLVSPMDGDLVPKALAALLRLPTVVGHSETLSPGARVRTTRDLLSSPGHLVLASRSTRAIEQDYAAIRHIEQGLYRGASRLATAR